MDSIFDPNHLSTAIAAVGALGTAAAGVVDGFKSLPGGGLSTVGFQFIEQAMQPFLGNVARAQADGGVRRAYDTLHASWINGVALADQKAIAKSLVKARLDADNAADFANVVDAGVDIPMLTGAARKMNLSVPGNTLIDGEKNALGRFDLALTSLIDAAYQHADQRYRNRAKLAATAVSVMLAVIGGLSNHEDVHALWQWAIAGLLATPLAPMAKDLASALQAGAKAAQSLRR